MGFITYILMAGVCLGMQQKYVRFRACRPIRHSGTINMVYFLRFSPEVLGIQASSALGWLLLELMIFTGSTYIIQTDLKVFDLLAFCTYKFVG